MNNGKQVVLSSDILTFVQDQSAGVMARSLIRALDMHKGYLFHEEKESLFKKVFEQPAFVSCLEEYLSARRLLSLIETATSSGRELNQEPEKATKQ